MYNSTQCLDRTADTCAASAEAAAHSIKTTASKTACRIVLNVHDIICHNIRQTIHAYVTMTKLMLVEKHARKQHKHR